MPLRFLAGLRMLIVAAVAASALAGAGPALAQDRTETAKIRLPKVCGPVSRSALRHGYWHAHLMKSRLEAEYDDIRYALGTLRQTCRKLDPASAAAETCRKQLGGIVERAGRYYDDWLLLCRGKGESGPAPAAGLDCPAGAVPWSGMRNGTFEHWCKCIPGWVPGKAANTCEPAGRRAPGCVRETGRALHGSVTGCQARLERCLRGASAGLLPAAVDCVVAGLASWNPDPARNLARSIVSTYGKTLLKQMARRSLFVIVETACIGNKGIENLDARLKCYDAVTSCREGALANQQTALAACPKLE